jgi:hypothetical protein
MPGLRGVRALSRPGWTGAAAALRRHRLGAPVQTIFHKIAQFTRVTLMRFLQAVYTIYGEE